MGVFCVDKTCFLRPVHIIILFMMIITCALTCIIQQYNLYTIIMSPSHGYVDSRVHTIKQCTYVLIEYLVALIGCIIVRHSHTLVNMHKYITIYSAYFCPYHCSYLLLLNLHLGRMHWCFCSTLAIVLWLLRSFDHLDHSRHAWPLLLPEKPTYRSHVYWQSALGTNIDHETGFLISHLSQIIL